MRVKIRGAIYDSKNEPVMVVLSEEEKTRITELGDGYMFCDYPDGIDPEAIENWMTQKGPLVI